MTHDETVRPCSICSAPDGLNFEDEMFLCDKCREVYEPTAVAAPVCELAAINNLLDVGTRKYAGSILRYARH